MKNIKKAIKNIVIIIIISVLLFCGIAYFYTPPSKQEISIGEQIKGYRIMNHLYSSTNLISIENNDNIFKIKFIQCYNNIPYEYTYNLNKEDYIYLYSKDIPANKTKIKITINNKTIVLENEDLIKKIQNKSKTK